MEEGGSQLKDAAVVYDGENSGTVSSVIKRDGSIIVMVEFESPLEVGDKLTGRYGNKGIVSKILPDEDMPKDNIETDLNKYKNLFPINITLENAKKMDSDGVIKEGSEVKPGDVLVAAIRKKVATEEDRMLSRLGKSIGSQLKDAAVIYDGENSGTISSVIKRDGSIIVMVEFESPLEVGDKLTGRYGNKGIVSKILPDEDMPKDKNGKSLDIIMNPIGTPSRINPIQNVEVANNIVTGKQIGRAHV